MSQSEPQLLREPPAFRRDVAVHAWIGVKALSDAGDALWTIALAWTAVQITTPAVAGVVVAAGTVPRAVILLFGGAVADRANPRHVMLVFNVIRIAVLVGVALWVLATPPTVTVLLAAAVAFGICDAFYEPSAGTIARQLVRVNDLPSYSAVMQTATRLGTMGGAAIGGFLVAQAGMLGSASANAVTFAFVVAFIALWLRPRFVLPRAHKESPIRQIARGFAHLKDAATTRTLVIALSGLNLAVGPAMAIGIALRAAEQGWGAGAVGIFEALVGAGAAIGAASVAKWRPRREAHAGFWALVVQGIAIICLGVGPAWLVAAGTFTIGLSAGYASVLLSATFAATVDTLFLGRMSALTRLGDDCLMPLAMAGFGALASVTALWVPFALYGAGLVVLMIFPLHNTVLRTLTLCPAEPAQSSPAQTSSEESPR
ncbi:MFS transporter [Paramicrobacterium agarici]|uniref:Putative MFS family arabinose efflux permease n=1 Tax=Paramicrobacterium agarici TaxID=630514 RepID=A0A2A9DYU2_9MICO|nr:MFS transporter [Microbacterium agarici]PFG31100.1 putative MFS family arabinose efflux permease [Microbacterium agarici]